MPSTPEEMPVPAPVPAPVPVPPAGPAEAVVPAPVPVPPAESAEAVAPRPRAPNPAKLVVVKKYANRRLYNTESSSYITLDTLADMIREGRDFVVYDAKSNDDITRGVLTQIIVEEENKGRALLPTSFLRQLIGFYGDSVQGLVPRYLEQAMSSFARQQEGVRLAMEKTLAPFIPFPVEEIGRQNMAMMERAMSLFSPFGFREPDAALPPPPAAGPHPIPQHAGDAGHAAELAAMRSEIEQLTRDLEASRAANAIIGRAVGRHAPEPHAPEPHAPDRGLPDPRETAGHNPVPLPVGPRRMLKGR